MGPPPDSDPTVAQLLADKERLERELAGARQAAETTSRLIGEQFMQIEETMMLLEEKIAVEQELRTSLAAELAAAEIREVELAEARALAEEANRAKSAFLANMSHELRTPLNAIIGYAELLVEELEELDTDEIGEVVTRISAAGHHLLGLINDVLDLSKIEAGKMELFIEEIDLAQIVGEVLATITPLSDKQKNRLLIELDPDLGPLHTDATKIRQILFNLLSNACKFTSGGEVLLAVRCLHIADEAWVELLVRDSGIGIAADKLERLFETFTQAEASTSSRYGGTGLGLAITRRLCLLMGGDISVSSIVGSGTTFTVRLPTAVPSANPGSSAPGLTVP
ncbi:MAG: hypothetical protein H6710_17125 [Myxococcales bacterium]|nr:hypothetical protein [Myxococcales bacterium]MCB9704920.1 hypothetical protein [Myxococcales bacterium]